MKKLFLMLVCVMAATSMSAQSLDKFFSEKATAGLCDMAHPSNDYLQGEYEIRSGYIDVSVTSKDNVLGGTVYTDVRVVRGLGDLYFSDIVVQKDTDPFAKPFDALELLIKIATQTYKSMDQEAYEKIRAEAKKQFGTDIEYWTGKMWAIFILNLEYYDFAIRGK